MSNLLYFGAGVAEAGSEYLKDVREKYDTNLERTTISLQDQLKTARAARKAKTEKASLRLDELEGMGITGAAADMMLRLSDPLYQTHVSRFLELGSPKITTSIRVW